MRNLRECVEVETFCRPRHDIHLDFMLERFVINAKVFVDGNGDFFEVFAMRLIVVHLLCREYGHTIKLVEFGIELFEIFCAFERLCRSKHGVELVAPTTSPFEEHLLFFEFRSALSSKRDKHFLHLLGLLVVF